MLLAVMWYMRVEKTRPDQRTSYLWVWQGLHTPGLKWLSTFLCLFVLRCPWSLGGGICHHYLWIWEYWLWFQSGKSPTLSYSIPEIPRKGKKVYMCIHTNIHTHTHWFTMYLLYVSTYLLIYVYIYIHICIHAEAGHTISVTGYWYPATFTNYFSAAEKPLCRSPALEGAQPRLRAAEHPSPTGKAEA